MKSCDCSVKGQEFPLSEGICLKMYKMTQLLIHTNIFQNWSVLMCLTNVEIYSLCF